MNATSIDRWLVVNDRVINVDWVTASERYIRTVLAVIEAEPGTYYVLSGNRPFPEPIFTTHDNVEKYWMLVVPEPRKVKVRQWYRESDGARVPWYPSDGEHVAVSHRSRGFVLLEVEGTEVQS